MKVDINKAIQQVANAILQRDPAAKISIEKEVNQGRVPQFPEIPFCQYIIDLHVDMSDKIKYPFTKSYAIVQSPLFGVRAIAYHKV